MIIPISVSFPNPFSSKLPAAIAKLGHDELFLIELQGTLDVEGGEGMSRDGQLIGKLNTADMNKPTLLIGHHLLEGAVVNLPQPLGVLQKDVHKQGESSDAEPGENEQRAWKITAVVKKKIVFSKRPMPIAKPASVASYRI
ncbi:Ctf8-domain-containing protein [Phlebopus sp. FC_14]|nr:Ctf8-domain-containing protein [Phlebopus sp. FC_14]